MKAACLALLIGAIAWPAMADTISAKEIAGGVSDQKTELAQVAWWDEHMSGKYHEISGKVADVEEGSFSGYWVNMKIGRNITVQCGMGDEFKATAVALQKGSPFTCRGTVSRTWTALFGVNFIMDMVADSSAGAEAPRRKSLLKQLTE